MLKNDLKIACRHILKYKIYSFINIGGLAVGIAASSLIFIYILDELYDCPAAGFLLQAGAGKIAWVFGSIGVTNQQRRITIKWVKFLKQIGPGASGGKNKIQLTVNFDQPT